MKILVITENDNCCGPIAVRFLNDFNEKVEACSAGVCPDEKVRHDVVELMHECFCDMSEYKPVLFLPSMLEEADYVIIIGELYFDAQSCKSLRLELPPQLAGAKTIGEMRALRDYIKNEAFVILKKLLGKS